MQEAIAGVGITSSALQKALSTAAANLQKKAIAAKGTTEDAGILAAPGEDEQGKRMSNLRSSSLVHCPTNDLGFWTIPTLILHDGE